MELRADDAPPRVISLPSVAPAPGSWEQTTAELERLRRVERAAATAQFLAGQAWWEQAAPDAPLTWSGSLERIIGLPAGAPLPGSDELIGMLLPADQGHLIAAVREARSANGTFDLEVRLRAVDGRQRSVRVWGCFGGEAAGDQSFPAWGVVTDVTELHEAKLLSKRAMHDPLTGLPNRMLLLDHLGRALARAERHGTHVAVMFLDLDHFKDVNDSLGHEVGDQLLVDIARRLCHCMRETDTAARMGGDEFVVVCEGMAGPEQAAISARRIERALRTVIGRPPSSLTVTASIGIATSSPGDTAAGLLRSADAAMYRAKERGRARWEMAPPSSA